MFKIAILSKWHVHAPGYAHQIRQNKDVEITAVWDEDKNRGRNWALELEVDFEESLDSLLSRSDIDGVIVCTPTNMHYEVIIKAAKAKKHIFTEKVLTFDKKSALEVKRVIEENNVKFVISFPQKTTPEYLYVKKMLDEGIIGTPTMTRFRNGHNGAYDNWLPEYWYNPKTCGGGALMDLGAHPMYLARWFLGEPKAISSTFTHLTNREVDDNAVCSILFKNNAIAVVESSLTTYYSPYCVEIYGTEGTIYIREGEVEIKSKKYNDQIVVIKPNTLRREVAYPLDHWIDVCTKNSDILFGIDDAVGLTELMEGAYISAKEKKTLDF